VSLPARLGLIALATIASSLVGFAVNSRWLLPLLNALPACLLMIVSVARRKRAEAIGLMVWWALVLGLSSVALTMTWPERASEVILNGASYRDEMFAWLSTGMGRESTPSIFVPQHLAHAAVFCVLSLATGGCASILMGAVLMNYMSFYVGELIARCAGSPSHALAIALAWNPWSMVRVVSFIVLGVVLAEPLLSRAAGRGPDRRGRRAWLVAGAAGLLVDIVLKSLLAPRWPGLLGACLG